MLQYQSCVNHVQFKQAYEELLNTGQLPQVFKHSSFTPMPIEMTASLLRLKQQLIIEQDSEQREILLKAGSLEIIRFVSQLADMYTQQSKDKNKSVNQTLKQEQLNLQFSDILSEMRHALTHKDIPDKKLIIATIDYIFEYLIKNYWEIKLKEQSPILFVRAHIKHQLDAIQDENFKTEFEVYDSYTPQQLQIIVLYCLDYLIGLSDWHIVEKSIDDRLKDRKQGDLRIKSVSKFVICLIQYLFNNRNTNHVKRQLSRRAFICNDKSFQKLYNKLNIIGMIKPQIKEFVICFENELSEIKKFKKYDNLVLDQKIEKYDDLCLITPKKSKLVGQLFSEYIQNISNEKDDV